jgi:hypothetical protein
VVHAKQSASTGEQPFAGSERHRGECWQPRLGESETSNKVTIRMKKNEGSDRRRARTAPPQTISIWGGAVQFEEQKPFDVGKLPLKYRAFCEVMLEEAEGCTNTGSPTSVNQAMIDERLKQLRRARGKELRRAQNGK